MLFEITDKISTCQLVSLSLSLAGICIIVNSKIINFRLMCLTNNINSTFRDEFTILKLGVLYVLYTVVQDKHFSELRRS